MGNPAPYSREISVGITLSVSDWIVSHLRVSRRGPSIIQLTVSPVILSEETCHFGRQNKPQIKQMLPRPPYLISDVQRALFQFDRPLVLNADP